MTTATPWGLHPQLDADTHPLLRLGLSELLLFDDENYPWLILVPRIVGARELVDLDVAQQAQLMAEVTRASRALQQAFRPHKLNVAALGNVLPQLHVHVIARFVDDPAWPTPVWGRVAMRRYGEDAREARVRAVRAALGA